MQILDRICSARSLRQQIAGSRDRLYKVALAWSGDAMVADDLVQETLETALDKSHQLREADRLYAWMYSIMNNYWRHYLRRQRPDCELDETQHASDSDPEALSGQHELVVRVRAAIARLPVGQREVLTLVDLEGFAYQEVADILEIPIGTVMSRLNRARGFLQTALRNIRPESTAQSARLRRVQ
jgi:RNA polymerase sigma-70 factor (ECF subfamily)